MDQFFALLSQLYSNLTQPLLRLAQVLILWALFCRAALRAIGRQPSFFLLGLRAAGELDIHRCGGLQLAVFRLIPLLSVYPLGMVMLNLLWLGWIGAPFPRPEQIGKFAFNLILVILHLAIAVLMVFDTRGRTGPPGTQWMAVNGSQV